jgi:hypothetical protein
MTRSSTPTSTTSCPSRLPRRRRPPRRRHPRPEPEPPLLEVAPLPSSPQPAVVRAPPTSRRINADLASIGVWSRLARAESSPNRIRPRARSRAGVARAALYCRPRDPRRGCRHPRPTGSTEEGEPLGDRAVHGGDVGLGGPARRGPAREQGQPHGVPRHQLRARDRAPLQLEAALLAALAPPPPHDDRSPPARVGLATGAGARRRPLAQGHRVHAERRRPVHGDRSRAHDRAQARRSWSAPRPAARPSRARTCTSSKATSSTPISRRTPATPDSSS